MDHQGPFSAALEEGGYKATGVYHLIDYPDMESPTWELVPLPEPVLLEAGRPYGCGIDESGPFVRPIPGLEVWP